MKAMYIVCWVLFHQPVATLENCSPPLTYVSAQSVMQTIITAGVVSISMRSEQAAVTHEPIRILPPAPKENQP